MAGRDGRWTPDPGRPPGRPTMHRPGGPRDTGRGRPWPSAGKDSRIRPTSTLLGSDPSRVCPPSLPRVVGERPGIQSSRRSSSRACARGDRAGVGPAPPATTSTMIPVTPAPRRRDRRPARRRLAGHPAPPDVGGRSDEAGPLPSGRGAGRRGGAGADRRAAAPAAERAGSPSGRFAPFSPRRRFL